MLSPIGKRYNHIAYTTEPIRYVSLSIVTAPLNFISPALVILITQDGEEEIGVFNLAVCLGFGCTFPNTSDAPYDPAGSCIIDVNSHIPPLTYPKNAASGFNIALLTFVIVA